MIISHKHGYLFIEIPLTASWAVRHELCKYYGGTPILHKHASYPEFRRISTADERGYFVFATVRNPLDVAVSRYFKLKTDHKSVFTDAESLKASRVDYSDLKKYRFVEEENATFEDYFRKYHRRPFNGMIHLSSGNTDYVMRYERLQGDFSEVLRRLGIEQARPVPVMNKTPSKKAQWQSYYTASIIEQAKRNFGPFMQRWGYEFTADWGDYSPSWIKEAEFRLLSMVAKLYLTRFRYSQGVSAKLVRLLRAFWIR